MGRPHLNPLAGVGLDPAIGGATTGKHQGMFAIVIAYGKLDVATEGCAGSGLPGPGF
jgi:hypothetical protein